MGHSETSLVETRGVTLSSLLLWGEDDPFNNSCRSPVSVEERTPTDTIGKEWPRVGESDGDNNREARKSSPDAPWVGTHGGLDGETRAVCPA